MKLKSWMETHIVRPKRKNKKDPGKQQEKGGKGKGGNSDLTVTLPQRPPLDSAGNSPTSPQLPNRPTLLLPERMGDEATELMSTSSPARFFLRPGQVTYLADRTNQNHCYYSPQLQRLPCPNGRITSSPPVHVTSCTCFVDDQCNQVVEDLKKLHSIRTTYTPLDRLQDLRNANLNSPRQRSKIRTNPWVPLPTGSRDSLQPFRTSSSSSDCGSASDESAMGGGGVVAANSSSGGGSSSGTRNSYMSVGSDDPRVSSGASSASVRSVNGGGEGSDSDECETLNELGHFEENYEYERETDILDDDLDDLNAMPAPTKCDGDFRTPTPEHFGDIDAKLQFADTDETSSEDGHRIEEETAKPPRPHLTVNIISADDRTITTTDDNDDDLLIITTPTTTTTDSACPSDSDLLSTPPGSLLTSPTSDSSASSGIGGASSSSPASSLPCSPLEDGISPLTVANVYAVSSGGGCCSLTAEPKRNNKEKTASFNNLLPSMPILKGLSATTTTGSYGNIAHSSPFKRGGVSTGSYGNLTPVSREGTTQSPKTPPRTLHEIRESLEEKVRRLRHERLLVEEKIREAREEERLRREEKIRFQKQLILHRRQILLRTLHNLRRRLEDQSVRLQDAYTSTLQMQLEVRRHRCDSDVAELHLLLRSAQPPLDPQPLPVVPTDESFASPLAQEAPF